MVVDNFPPVRKFSQNEGEHTARPILCAFKLPVPKHPRRGRREESDFKVGEFQLTHFRFRVVALLIFIKRFLPAAPDLTPAGEEQAV